MENGAEADGVISDGLETPELKLDPNAKTPVEVTVKKPPKPKVEEVEEALDEGLY